MLIETSLIKIPDNYSLTKPKKFKMKQHITYYKANKRLQKKLIVDQNYNLLDGYIDYLVALKYRVKVIDCVITQSPTPYIKIIVIKVGVFESEIVNEKHFGVNDSKEISEFYNNYRGNEYIKVKTYM